jgi:hypothetical protein
MALTWNQYWAPLVRPVMVQLKALPTWHCVQGPLGGSKITSRIKIRIRVRKGRTQRFRSPRGALVEEAGNR